MRKVLVVNQFYLKKSITSLPGYEVSYLMLFREIPAFLKGFRFLHQLLALPFFSIWYIKDWSQVFRGYDLIIMHDSPKMHANYFIKKITANTDLHTKLVLYYWNSIYDLPDLKLNERWEVVSFDYQDAAENNLRYVGGFFIPEKLQEKKKDIDLFFVGTDKGRFGLLEKLEADLKKLAVKTQFFLVSNKSRFNRKYSSAIPYGEVVDWLSKSKGIVEITKPGQFGLTLRAYEAVFYNKKLVSNNAYLKRYDFYDPEKIYILENSSEDPKNIAEFLKGDDIYYTKETVENYSFADFIRRVDEHITLQNVST